MLRFAEGAENFLRCGAQQPLQVAVLFVALRKVVILGGVGGSAVSHSSWYVERHWELGWLWGRSGRGGGGGCYEGTGRGRLFLWEGGLF